MGKKWETPVEVLPILPAWTDQPAGPKAWCVSSRFQGQVLTMSFFQGQIPPSQVFQGQERVPRASTTALASLCNIIKYFRLLCKNLLLQATFRGWLHCLQKRLLSLPKERVQIFDKVVSNHALVDVIGGAPPSTHSSLMRAIRGSSGLKKCPDA